MSSTMYLVDRQCLLILTCRFYRAQPHSHEVFIPDNLFLMQRFRAEACFCATLYGRSAAALQGRQAEGRREPSGPPLPSPPHHTWCRLTSDQVVHDVLVDGQRLLVLLILLVVGTRHGLALPLSVASVPLGLGGVGRVAGGGPAGCEGKWRRGQGAHQPPPRETPPALPCARAPSAAPLPSRPPRTHLPAGPARRATPRRASAVPGKTGERTVGGAQGQAGERRRDSALHEEPPAAAARFIGGGRSRARPARGVSGAGRRREGGGWRGRRRRTWRGAGIPARGEAARVAMGTACRAHAGTAGGLLRGHTCLGAPLFAPPDGRHERSPAIKVVIALRRGTSALARAAHE